MTKCAITAFVLWSLTGCGGGFSQVKQATLQRDRARLATTARRPAIAGKYALVLDHIGHEYATATGLWVVDHLRVRRYVVYDPRNKRMRVASIELRSGEQLAKAEVSVLSADDGELRRFGRDRFVAKKLRHGHTLYSLSIPRLSRNDIVDVRALGQSVGRSRLPRVRHHVWLQRRLPVEQLEVRFACPRGVPLRIKRAMNTGTLALKVKKTEDRVLIWYRARDVAAIADRPYSGYLAQDARYLYVELHDGRTKSWRAFASRVRELLRPTTKASKADLWPIRRGKRGRAAFVQIVRHLRDSVRRRAKHRSRSAADIIARGGTRTQIAAAAASLLRLAGFEASLLLVHSSKIGRYDHGLVSRYEVDEPAVRARVDGQWVFAMPSEEYLPVGLLPGHLQGQPALVIDGPAAGSFIITPETPASAAQSERRLVVHADDNGTARVDELRTLRGLLAYRARRELLEQDAATRQKALRKRLDRAGVAQIESATISGGAGADQPLLLRYRYSVRGLLVRRGTRAVMLLGAALGSTRRRRPKRQRIRPLTNHHAMQLRRRLEVHLPLGWKLQSTFKPRRAQGELGGASMTLRHEGGRLELEHELSLRRFRVEVDIRSKLRALLALHSVGSPPPLVFSTGDAPNGGPRIPTAALRR